MGDKSDFFGLMKKDNLTLGIMKFREFISRAFLTKIQAGGARVFRRNIGKDVVLVPDFA